MGKTIIDLGASEAEITDPSQYFIETQKIGDTVTKKTVLTKVVTYLQTLFAPKFNAANTATGTINVTINATSGVAIFTQNLPGGASAVYTITNNTAFTGDKFNISVSGDFGSTNGILQYIGYNCPGAAIDIFFYNPTSDVMDVTFTVAFQKLN